MYVVSIYMIWMKVCKVLILILEYCMKKPQAPAEEGQFLPRVALIKQNMNAEICSIY